ncbi:MAG: toxin-antitoxin system HicB family antitoxin [Alphaproteobacteria bacterium]|nr:toxin-antitoxin system HicB family antitoxin [Alphaproteobacteria bacterium]
MSQYALRLPDSLMEAARKIAKRERTSINQLFLTAIAEKLSAIDTEEFIMERAVRADADAYRKVLQKIRDIPPQKGDELP